MKTRLHVLMGIAIMLCLIGGTKITWGQIAAWDNYSLSGTTSGSLNATTNDANLNTSVLSRGSGITASSLSSGYASTVWNASATTEALAKSGNLYYQVIINASSGYQVSLSTLDARLRRTSSGPNAYIWTYSTDGTNFTDIGSTVSFTTIGSTGDTQTQIDLSSIGSLQNVTSGTTITLRLYAWGANLNSGSLAFGTTNANSLAIGGTTAVAGTPSISVSPSTLIGFTYIAGSGPSTSQSYNLSGLNLTGYPGNITVNAASTDYEVSKDNSTFLSSVTVAYSSPTLGSTQIYVRLKSGLTAGNYNSEALTNAGGGAVTQNVTCSGAVYKPEPSNHVTSFATTAGTPSSYAISLTWTDATGTTTPDGYLIKGSSVSFASITAPVDGTAESDAGLDKNITQGTHLANYTALSASTTYYFKIFSYTNSSTNINYKIDGTIPTASLTTAAAPPTTLLFEENFNYVAASDLAAQGGWQIIGADGTNLQVSSSGLSYSGYPSSGGLAADITSSRDDDLGNNYAAQSGGTIYYSFLVNVSGTTGAGTYFTGLNTTATSSATYTGRVFAKISSGYVNFGLSKSTETETYSSTNYSVKTTYLLVVKYEFISGPSNDKASLFIFTLPTLPATEPGTPDIGPLSSTNDYASFSGVFLRQATGIPDLNVGGIRISTGWSDAPVPVELTSFKATMQSVNSVILKWSTATEVNNFGFEIERRAANSKQSMVNGWQKIGFVAGAGTSNSPKEYSFTDNGLAPGLQIYRIKQIDNGGVFKYSASTQVDVGVAAKSFKLLGNYPNPFNPSTEIRFSVPEEGFASLKVYNILGQEVATLFYGIAQSGHYIPVTFDGSRFASGVYFSCLKYNGKSIVQRMLMTK